VRRNRTRSSTRAAETTQLQREQELADELTAIGIRGPERGHDRLARQDHHVADLLEQASRREAPALGSGGQAVLSSGGAARGSIGIRVTGRPPKARVDPRTGKVIREKAAQER